MIGVACGSSDSPETPQAMTAPAVSARAPAGFDVDHFVSNLDHPTSMVWGPDGVLYVAQQNGDILAVTDANGDGIGDAPVIFASGFVLPLGLTLVDGDWYVSERGSVLRVLDRDGDGVSERLRARRDRPPRGRGPPRQPPEQRNRAGPGRLLIRRRRHRPGKPGTDESTEERKSHLGIGLDSDSDTGSGLGDAAASLSTAGTVDERAGTIIRFRPDGSDLTIYATGFKKPVGLTFDSAGNLFATDIGLNIPEGPDELNYIPPGSDYCYPRTADGLNHLGDLPVVAQLEVAARGLCGHVQGNRCGDRLARNGGASPASSVRAGVATSDGPAVPVAAVAETAATFDSCPAAASGHVISISGSAITAATEAGGAPTPAAVRAPTPAL